MADGDDIDVAEGLAPPGGVVNPEATTVPALSDAEQAQAAGAAAAARQTRAYRGGRPLPQEAPAPAQPAPQEGENPYARFGGSPDDGIGLYERARLNAVNSYYRGTLAGVGRMTALAHLVRTPDGPDVAPEAKALRDQQRVEYQRIIADLARYDLIAGYSGYGEAAAALGGTLGASLLSPESFIGAGAGRGASMLYRTLRAGASQAAVMAAVDPVLQAGAIHAGAEQHFSFSRWLASAGIGAVLGGGIHIGGELIGNAALKGKLAAMAAEDAQFFKPDMHVGETVVDINGQRTRVKDGEIIHEPGEAEPGPPGGGGAPAGERAPGAPPAETAGPAEAGAPPAGGAEVGGGAQPRAPAPEAPPVGPQAPAPLPPPTPVRHRVTTPSGMSVEVEPMVVEARDLITSADEGYDQALQPRNRDRAAAQQQVREIASNLDPERLGYSTEADRGAPIVGEDRMVESGNGRVAAIRQIYKEDFGHRTRANEQQRNELRDMVEHSLEHVGRFQMGDAEHSVLVTKSPREGINWQVTFFEGREPTGHIDVSGDMNDLTRELIAHARRFNVVAPAELSPAQRYREWLESQGIDISKFNEPVLVRRRITPLTPEERAQFTVGANQQATLTYSASERALADARGLDANTLELIRVPGDLAAAGNQDFVRAFVQKLPQAEQGAMLDAQGHLSAEGLTRVRNAVLAAAYGDSPTLARIAESTHDEVKSISNALVTTAPEWAKLRADIRAGTVRADVDLTDELVEAVTRTADLRAGGVKLKSFLAQQDAFNQLAEPVEAFMRMFYDPAGNRAINAQRIADALTFYAQEARKVSAERGLDLGLPDVTSETLQRAALERQGKHAAESTLLARGEAGAGAGGAARGGQVPGPAAGAGGAETGGPAAAAGAGAGAGDELKVWFGDSKAVDKDGEPLLVYHGTAAGDLEELRPSAPLIKATGNKDLEGIYFTGDERSAHSYARMAMNAGKGEVRKVIPAFLKIERPFETAPKIKALQKKGMSFGDAKREVLKQFDADKYDGIIFAGDGVNPPEYMVLSGEQVRIARPAPDVLAARTISRLRREGPSLFDQREAEGQARMPGTEGGGTVAEKLQRAAERPLTGGAAGPAEGGLFDTGARDQGDLFAPAAKPREGQLFAHPLPPGALAWFPGAGARGRFAQRDLQAWLDERGAIKRTVYFTKDVTLPSGDVLPNRQMRNDYFELADGSTVQVKSETMTDGPSGRATTSYRVVPYDPPPVTVQRRGGDGVLRAMSIPGTEVRPSDIQAKSEGGMPSREAVAAETGGASISSSAEAPPSAQPLPGVQVSTRPEPSGSATTRAAPPSIIPEATTVKFADRSLGAIEPTTGKKVLQATDDYKALLAAAEENRPRLTQGLAELTHGIEGVHVYGARVKDEPGLVAKIEAKKRPPSTISDYLGARIIADTPEAMTQVLERLHATGAVIEAEDFVHTPKEGYRAYHMQVGLGDGTSAEIQIVPGPIAAMMQRGHAIRQPVKRLDLSKPEQFAEFRRIMAEGVKLYEDAWAHAPEWQRFKFEAPEPALASIAERRGAPGGMAGGRLPMEGRRSPEGVEAPAGTIPQVHQPGAQQQSGGAVTVDPNAPSPQQHEAVQSLQQQTMNLADALGFPLREGRVKLPPGAPPALAIFKTRSGVVRTQEIADFEAVAHEAGHYIEYSVGQPLHDMVQAHEAELARLVSNHAAYDQSMWAKEGFAEYIRRSMSNPAYAQAQAPAFTIAFTDYMRQHHPDILQALNDAATAYRAYLDAPSVDAVGAVIRSTDEGVHGWRSFLPRKIQREGFPVIIKTLFQEGYTAYLDRNAPVARAVREMLKAIRDETGQLVDLKAADNPEILLRLFARTQQAAVRDMMDGVRGHRSIVPEGPSLAAAVAHALGEASVFGKWNGELKEAFSTYLIARRAEVLWEKFARGELPNPPVAFSAGDANVARVDLERANPQFRRASDMVHEWTRQLLKKQFDAGLIGRDLYTRLAQEEFYVPFMRDLSDKPMAAGPAVGGGGAPGERVADTVKRLKGSSRDIKDPIESLMMQAFLVNRATRHNDIIRALVDLGGRAGFTGGRFVEKIPAQEARRYTFDLKEAIERAAQSRGMNADDTTVLTSALSDIFGEDPIVGSFFRHEPAGARGEPIVFYKEGGEMRAARLMAADEGHALYETLTALPQGLSDLGLQLLSTGSSLFRGSIVTNPVFALTNYIRDQVAVGILRPDYIPFISGNRGIVSEVTQGESAKLYGYAGGVSAGASVAPLEQAAKAEIDALAKQGYLMNRLTSLHGLLELSSITEAGTRNSVFAKVFEQKKAQGLSDYEAMIEAAYQAQDILDFSRYGSKTMAMRALTPFVNAHIQGLEKAWRTLVEPLYRTAVTTADPAARRNAIIGVTKFMAVGGTLGAAWAALHQHDEIYQDAKPELKGTHFVTSIGNKLFVVPKPFELSLGFTAGEFAFQRLYQHDQRAAMQFAEAAWEVLKPPVPIFDNPGIKTSFELALGKSSFLGRDIVPDALQRLAPAEQYTDRTSSIAKWLGQAVGVSPIKIDYGIGAYFGLWGRDIMQLSSGVDERTPAQNWEDRALVRRFIKDPTRSSDVVAQFWKFMGQTSGQFNQDVATYDFLVKGFRDADAQKFVSNLSDAERAYVTLRSAADEDGKPAFNADQKRVFPLQRAYDAVALLNGVRRELSDDSFHTFESGQRVQLSPRERRDLIDNVRELAQTEMRNAFVIMKQPGWERRPLMELEPILDKIRKVSPAVADEIVTRYATGRVYTTRAVAQNYTMLKDELLRNGSQADLGDIVGDARDGGYEFGGERVRKPQKRRLVMPAR